MAWSDAVISVVAGAAAVVLVVAGVAKLTNHTPTRIAVRELGWAISSKWVLLFGAAELVGGAILFVTLWRVAAALAAIGYLLFVVIVWRLMFRSTPCGCFGKSEIPPGWGHIAMNAVASLACVAVAVVNPGAPTWRIVVSSAALGGVVAWLATRTGSSDDQDQDSAERSMT